MTAVEYFWPDVCGRRRFWGGYAKFFQPALPSRIGTPLLHHIYKALYDGDETSKQAAIAILQSEHKKTISHIKGVEPKVVICKPTEEASLAISYLNGKCGI